MRKNKNFSQLIIKSDRTRFTQFCNRYHTSQTQYWFFPDPKIISQKRIVLKNHIDCKNSLRMLSCGCVVFVEALRGSRPALYRSSIRVCQAFRSLWISHDGQCLRADPWLQCTRWCVLISLLSKHDTTRDSDWKKLQMTKSWGQSAKMLFTQQDFTNSKIC